MFNTVSLNFGGAQRAPDHFWESADNPRRLFACLIASESEPDRKTAKPKTVAFHVVDIHPASPESTIPSAGSPEDLQAPAVTRSVYTQTSMRSPITIMNAFRMDLFVSVTLPIILAAAGMSALGLTAYIHLDSKLDAAKVDAGSSIDHLGDKLRVELRADREARSKEFEVLRSEMREDRKEARDSIKDLLKKP